MAACRTALNKEAMALLERWRFSLLLVLLVGAFFLQPVADGTNVGRSLHLLFYAGIFGAVVHLSGEALGYTRFGAAIIVAWAGMSLLTTFVGGTGLGLVALIVTLLLVGWITACTVGLLFYEAKADGDALAGAVFGYFLLALLWSVLYVAIEASAPGSIGVDREVGHVRTEMLYFSLVTITTLGYGDILPISPFAKIAAGIEAALGTLYLAILIGRIVGALKPPHRKARGTGGPGE